MQKQLGVDQPDYGMLFDDMAMPDGWEIGRKQLIQPKVEAEVAFVLGRDLDQERITIADVIRAQWNSLCRRSRWSTRALPTGRSAFSTPSPTMLRQAFTCSARRPKKLKDLDLRLAGMVMESAGEPISVGAGAACLGDPLVGGAVAGEDHGRASGVRCRRATR